MTYDRLQHNPQSILTVQPPTSEQQSGDQLNSNEEHLYSVLEKTTPTENNNTSTERNNVSTERNDTAAEKEPEHGEVEYANSGQDEQHLYPAVNKKEKEKDLAIEKMAEYMNV